MIIIFKIFEKLCMILGLVYIFSWLMVLMVMIVLDRVGGLCLWNLYCIILIYLLCLYLMNVVVDYIIWSVMCIMCFIWFVI